MPKNITKQRIKTFQIQFDKDDKNRIAQNSVLRTNLKKVTLSASRFGTINHQFSIVVPDEMKVTNQKRSGRCWIFAALNLVRVETARKFKFEEFEYSQSYLFFWDKFEKANLFFESIVETADEPFDSRVVSHLLCSPIQDGGQWTMFVSLVEKYGLVPISVYPDSEGCFDSGEMNYIITLKLREYAIVLRKLVARGTKRPQIEKEKENMLSSIYRMLCIFLGTPPEKFDWGHRTKDKKYISENNITPVAFAKKYNTQKISTYLALVHSPRKSTPLNKTYTVKFLGNVHEGQKVHYLNVETKVMKDAVIQSIKAKEPVWFGCDVGKCFDRALGIMDSTLFERDLLFSTKFGMTKAERMDYQESLMTHAMLFTGVDIVNGKPTKWRVENSWGKESGDKGYFIMTDDWFDEYMFEVAVNPKFLPKSILDAYKGSPIVLPPWDPLGACAT